eukprot:gene16959-7738_t
MGGGVGGEGCRADAASAPPGSGVSLASTRGVWNRARLATAHPLPAAAPRRGCVTARATRAPKDKKRKKRAGGGRRERGAVVSHVPSGPAPPSPGPGTLRRTPSLPALAADVAVAIGLLGRKRREGHHPPQQQSADKKMGGARIFWW